MLGADVAVPELASLLLPEHYDLPSALGEPLEHDPERSGRARRRYPETRGTGYARSATTASREGSSGDSPPRDRKAIARLHTVAESRETFGEEALGGANLHDLVLQGLALGRRDLDGLALLLPEDCAADGRLVRELLLEGVRLRGTDDVVLDRLLGGDVTQPDLRSDDDDVLRDLLLVDHAGRQQALLELGDLVLEHCLLVLRMVVLGVLADVAELARDADAVGDLPALVGREILDLVLQLLVTLGGEDHFLHVNGLLDPKKRAARRAAVAEAAHGSGGGGRRQHAFRYLFPLCAGKSTNSLENRGGRDPHTRRPRTDGRCERSGISTPGAPVRGRARMLGDGQLRRARAPERAHAR